MNTEFKEALRTYLLNDLIHNYDWESERAETFVTKHLDSLTMQIDDAYDQYIDFYFDED